MYARGQMQTHAKFFSCIPCPSCSMFRPWVSLLANPCPMLVVFSRFTNTGGTRSIVSEIPPTNLQHSEPVFILSKVRLYGGRLAAANVQTQMHAHECRQMQTNARQTVSSMWADTTSRHVWTLDVCSKDFWDALYYSVLNAHYVQLHLLPRPHPEPSSVSDLFYHGFIIS